MVQDGVQGHRCRAEGPGTGRPTGPCRRLLQPGDHQSRVAEVLADHLDVLQAQAAEVVGPAYVASMRRLLDLDVVLVHPGHDQSFDGDRMRELVEDYLRLRAGC